MTQRELLSALLNHGIVHKLGDEWFLTDAYKALGDAEVNMIEIEDVEVKAFNKYPDEIRLVKPSLRVTAILDYCKVPRLHTTSTGRKYQVRNNDAATRAAIDKIMSNNSIDATILLRAITEYYANTDFPKSFKNFVKDNTIMETYELIKEGGSLSEDAHSKDPGIWM